MSRRRCTWRLVPALGRFHADRGNHHALIAGRETVQALVRGQEGGSHLRLVLPRQLERRVRTGNAQVHAAALFDVGTCDLLPLELGARLGAQPEQGRAGGGHAVGVERCFDAAAAHEAALGKPDAPGRQHARQRVQQQRLDAQQVRHGAGVLAGGAAERHQREALRVLAVAERQLADRVGHLRHRDVHERGRERLDVVARPTGRGNVARNLGESRP